jgi:hypothetical protein
MGAVSVTAGQINKEEVIVTLNITMMLKDWKVFYQELPDKTQSTLLKDGLQSVFAKIK